MWLGVCCMCQLKTDVPVVHPLSYNTIIIYWCKTGRHVRFTWHKMRWQIPFIKKKMFFIFLTFFTHFCSYKICNIIDHCILRVHLWYVLHFLWIFKTLLFSRHFHHFSLVFIFLTWKFLVSFNCSKNCIIQIFWLV